jgi:hypothetical protein
MVCLVVVGSAILLEAIQMLTPDRDARALDAIQKIVGGMLGIIVVNVTRSRRGRSPDRDPTPEEQGKDPAAVALGKKGGKARADSMTAEKRAEIAKKAAKPF